MSSATSRPGSRCGPSASRARRSMPIGHTAVAGWHGPFPSAPSGFAEIPKAAHDPHARLEYMDSLRIWAMALYPNVSGFGSQAFLKLREPELMLACVRAYNDFLTDWCAPARERFIPISAMPFWDVEASVQEIERCAKAGHKGVLFTGAPQDHGMPALASPHWNPLWACAQSPRPPDQLPHRLGRVHERRLDARASRALRAGRHQRPDLDRPLPRERPPDRRPALLRASCRAIPS